MPTTQTARGLQSASAFDVLNKPTNRMNGAPQAKRHHRMSKLPVLISATALAIALLCSGAQTATDCGAPTKPGGLCSCRVLELRPTQLAVGMIEVREKEAELSSKSGSKLVAYQQKHPEPVVKGPGGALFITDHHHLARAMADLGIETTFCQLEADYSAFDPSAFWAKMEGQHWVYLYDENGKGPREPADLPSTVEGLKDDPYRSLSGAVRHDGGFVKVSTPFAEFKWADFFRSKILVTDIDKDFRKAVRKASAFASERNACALPGYKGPSPCG
jgi:hypothetical protein